MRTRQCLQSAQYSSVQARDAMNRRQDERLIIVETAIYRVFVMIYRIFSDLEFSSKNLNRTTLTVSCDARDV
ncbi:hypothetical protein [Nostoc sp.]|uniref:hypothetical protein n=1 Tax=Nostoc sp. TaxID=1180 RepID=UPI002FF59284